MVRPPFPAATEHTLRDVRLGRSPASRKCFALNWRYLINEKGAIEAAAQLTLTIPDLSKRAASVWRAIGTSAFGKALAELRSIECELKRLTAAR